MEAFRNVNALIIESTNVNHEFKKTERTHPNKIFVGKWLRRFIVLRK